MGWKRRGCENGKCGMRLWMRREGDSGDALEQDKAKSTAYMSRQSLPRCACPSPLHSPYLVCCLLLVDASGPPLKQPSDCGCGTKAQQRSSPASRSQQARMLCPHTPALPVCAAFPSSLRAAARWWVLLKPGRTAEGQSPTAAARSTASVQRATRRKEARLSPPSVVRTVVPSSPLSLSLSLCWGSCVFAVYPPTAPQVPSGLRACDSSLCHCWRAEGSRGGQET
jgi:hypothetical protein